MSHYLCTTSFQASDQLKTSFKVEKLSPSSDPDSDSDSDPFTDLSTACLDNFNINNRFNSAAYQLLMRVESNRAEVQLSSAGHWFT